LLQGVHQVTEAGTWKLVFDNSYSMLSSKKLLYHAEVENFNEHYTTGNSPRSSVTELTLEPPKQAI